MSIITLLTDFGCRDEYVGLMKGVILSIHPAATIVDITHQIDRQNLMQAAYAIHGSYRYFPEGSVHLVVVDPGVGTDRSMLAMKLQNQYFIAPDNGVLSLLLDEDLVDELIDITNSEFFLDTVSHTFHGRDIIAPVGAHIARGVELRQLGNELVPADAIRLTNIRARTADDQNIVGRIVAVDHFGNLITNIEHQMMITNGLSNQTNRITIQIGSHTIHGMGRTYENGHSNTPMALIGSRGYLEIAVPGGNAARQLNVRSGARVQVKI